MNLWHWHGSVAVGLGALVALYATGVGRRAERRHWLAFLGGTLALAAALLGPLAEWAERVSLSAHMVQHLVLTLVVPPLWLVGTPPRGLAPLLGIPGVRAAGAALTQPVVALTLASAVLLAWHRPLFFDAALHSEPIHVLEHLTLLGTAVLAWWPLAGPLREWPRPAAPAQLLYVFLSTIPMMVAAAPITLAEQVLYPFYAGQPWPLDPRADQELAGVLMWVVGPLAYLLAGTLIFFRWASLEEADAAPAAVPEPR